MNGEASRFGANPSAVEILRNAAFRVRQDTEHEVTNSARRRFGVNHSAKGNFGEIEMDRCLIDLGCVPVAGTKRLNDLHTGRGTHGIDGLYWRTATSRFLRGEERLIIVEVKPGRSLPAKNAGANQMTPEWIAGHLEKSVVDEAAKEAFLIGDWAPVLCNYDDAGEVTLFRLEVAERNGKAKMRRGEIWTPQQVGQR